MNATLITQIRDHLSAYLRGDTSLSVFEAWFVPNTWNLGVVDNETRGAIDDIDARLAEYANGDWDEDELKELLRPWVETYRNEWNLSDTQQSQVTEVNDQPRILSLQFFLPLRTEIRDWGSGLVEDSQRNPRQPVIIK